MDELFDEEVQENSVSLELDRLTPCARAALDCARTEAEGFGDSFVGTDHLLIGLTSVSAGAACRVLASLDIDSARVTERMRFIRGGETPAANGETDYAFSPRLTRVLEGAAKDAAKRNHAELGTLHLLSGMLREREGLAVFLLESPGLGLERAGNAISSAHREGWRDDSPA